MPYNSSANAPRAEPTGTAQLPLTRVKKIIAVDPDIAMCSTTAAFVITLATEKFIQHLSSSAHTAVLSERSKPRKNIQYRDVAAAVSRSDALEFLSDTIPRTQTYGEVKARRANGNAIRQTHISQIPTGGISANVSSLEGGQTTIPMMSMNGTNGIAPIIPPSAEETKARMERAMGFGSMMTTDDSSASPGRPATAEPGSVQRPMTARSGMDVEDEDEDEETGPGKQLEMEMLPREHVNGNGSTNSNGAHGDVEMR